MKEYRCEAERTLEEHGCENVRFFTDYSFDTALIGISNDNRAIYDYDLMVEYLLQQEGFEDIYDAISWIDENTLKSLSYEDDRATIILYRFAE